MAVWSAAAFIIYARRVLTGARPAADNITSVRQAAMDAPFVVVFIIIAMQVRMAAWLAAVR
jgi:hypothetical protein